VLERAHAVLIDKIHLDLVLRQQHLELAHLILADSLENLLLKIREILRSRRHIVVYRARTLAELARIFIDQSENIRGAVELLLFLSMNALSSNFCGSTILKMLFK